MVKSWLFKKRNVGLIILKRQKDKKIVQSYLYNQELCKFVIYFRKPIRELPDKNYKSLYRTLRLDNCLARPWTSFIKPWKDVSSKT